MKYEAWAAAEKNAVAAINAFGKLGIHVTPGDPDSTLALLQTVRARAFDHAADEHRNAAPRGEADMYAEDADDLDPADLKKLLAAIETELSAGTLGKHSQFFSMLARQIKGYLSAGKDCDAQRGRAMRDQMDAASRVTGKASNVDPWGNYEAGATDQGRRHLARSRRLAGRAADAKPAPGKSFLGRRPERGTDLDSLDRQAARTFNL